MDGRTIGVILSALAQLRGQDRPPTAPALAAGVVGVALALFAVVAAVACGAAALWLYAIAYVGVVGAPLIVALALLIIAALLLIAARQEFQFPRRRPSHGNDIAALIEQLATGLDGPAVREIGQLAKRNAPMIALAAAIAGLVAGSAGGQRRKSS